MIHHRARQLAPTRANSRQLAHRTADRRLRLRAFDASEPGYAIRRIGTLRTLRDRALLLGQRPLTTTDESSTDRSRAATLAACLRPGGGPRARFRWSERSRHCVRRTSRLATTTVVNRPEKNMSLPRHPVLDRQRRASRAAIDHQSARRRARRRANSPTRLAAMPPRFAVSGVQADSPPLAAWTASEIVVRRKRAFRNRVGAGVQ